MFRFHVFVSPSISIYLSVYFVTFENVKYATNKEKLTKANLNFKCPQHFCAAFRMQKFFSGKIYWFDVFKVLAMPKIDLKASFQLQILAQVRLPIIVVKLRNT